MMLDKTARVCGLLVLCLTLGSCGGGLGLTGNSEKEPQQSVSLTRPNTTQNRLLQVSSTAAKASYCAFGMDREKLKASYLAYEQSQGVPPETIARLNTLYDSTYQLFYNQVRQNPDYCSRENIEAIRPDINRHLRGDFSPSERKPDVQQAKVKTPEYTAKKDRVDITSGGADNPVFQGKERW